VALLTIKPSRGTIVFFILLTVGLAVRFGWDRHEEFVQTRDTPPTQTVRYLLRCVLGKDAQRVLGARPTGNNPTPWELRITDRLRRVVSDQYDRGWPGNCVPLADQLRLQLTSGRTPNAHQAEYYATQLQVTLTEARRDKVNAVAQVENRTLGFQLAALALEVTALTNGTERGWDSPLRESRTDLEFTPPTVPTPVWLPAEADYATLSRPNVVLYQSATERTLHVVTYDSHQRVQNNRVLGLGAPVRGTPENGAVLVVNDLGESLFVPANTPEGHSLIPLPNQVRGNTVDATRTEVLDRWHFLQTPQNQWLLTESDRTLRLRRRIQNAVGNATPANHEEWSDPLTIPAWTEVSGATITPVELVALGNLGGNPRGNRRGEPEGVLIGAPSQELVDVIAIRQGATDVHLERWRTNGNEVLHSMDEAGNDSDNPETEPTKIRWVEPAWNPSVVTCSHQDTRYTLVVTDEGMISIRWKSGVFATARTRFSTIGAPISSGAVEVSCNNDGLLLHGTFGNRGTQIVYFDAERGSVSVVPPPLFGPNARVAGVGLVEGNKLVVFVATAQSLRAYHSRRSASLSAGDTTNLWTVWEGGALIDIRPAVFEGQPTEFFEIGQVVTRENSVGVLVVFRTRTSFVLGRIGSNDGGLTWTSS